MAARVDGTDPPHPDVHPRERVAAAVDRFGTATTVTGCTALLGLAPGTVPDGRDLELAMILGGLTDPDWLAGGKPPGHAYWARVWGARALLYVWAEGAESSVVAALGDEHWRVREMAAKVIAAREVGEAADALAALGVDDVPRVRAAAARALATVGEAEHAAVLHELADDPEPLVARAARSALTALAGRLDRTV